MEVSNKPTEKRLKLKWELHLKTNREISDDDIKVYKQDIENLKNPLCHK